ncbi:MAG: tetratricopeptide repeat protein, partial [Pirellulales bacterium]
AVKRFDEEAVAASIVAQFRLESARLAIARGQHEQALEILDPGPPSGAEQTAAWDYELLVALLRQWQQAEGTSQAGEWQTKATEQVRLIEARHSPYWRRRAESLLGSIVAASPATDDLEVLVRAAQSYYRSGNIDDASAAYQRAYQQAVKSQSVDRAFDIGYTLASIEHQRQRHAAAAERYRELALAHSGHERAPQAHLMAIFNAAQALRGQATPDAGEYVALLAEHLGRWPRSESTDQARIWLGRLHQQHGDWEAAAEAFSGVRAESTHAAEAVDRAAACYRAWLAESNRANERTRIADSAADYFESVVFGQTQSWPEEFSPPQRAAALHAARFRLQHAGGDYDRVEKLLAVAIDRAGDADDQWRSATRVWLALAIAMQPNRSSEAVALLEKLSAVDPDELLGLSRSLNEAAADASPTAAVELARLQLQVVQRLRNHSERLSRAQATQVALAEAAALVLVGDTDRARAAYAQLAGDLPNDGDLQATYGELLLASDDQNDWQQALLKWREIERRSPPNSTRWYAAKLAQATAYEKLGNCRQALRIIALTRVLHSDLGGPAMKKKFEAIEQRCGG